MKTSKNGIELIKHFESLRLDAYFCPANILTIGYGHTGSDVKKGMIIPVAQADRMLLADLDHFEKSVNELVKVTLNQNQFDALISFAFNLGVGALSSSTLLKLLNSGDYTNASYEFDKWSKAKINGVMTTMKGLLRRRLTERYLFDGQSLDNALLHAKLKTDL